jgi:hypothetical protein
MEICSYGHLFKYLSNVTNITSKSYVHPSIFFKLIFQCSHKSFAILEIWPHYRRNSKIIINLDSDSDTDSEGDHDSEGETTDMYWLSTTEMNSNMWSVLTNSKSANFIISMSYQMFTYWPYQIWPQYWKSDHVIEEIPKIIINLDSDSDTDSERDHDREGETTDMYWSE